MFNFNREIIKIKEQIRQLDNRKIQLLSEITFNKWNKCTEILEKISILYVNVGKAESQKNILPDIVEDITERQKEIRDFQDFIKGKDMEIRDLTLELRSLLKEEISEEKIIELQKIYIEIYQLEDRVKGLNDLNQMEYE